MLNQFDKPEQNLLKGILLLLLALPMITNGQGRGAHWYFGAEAGLKFGPSGPTALTDGAMTTGEGCATMSSRTGDLLFYTDGSTVWNRLHGTMPNGTGLLGHASSCMSAIIVPQPGNDSIYFVFTIDGGTGMRRGVHWSRINMNLDGGKGDVTSTKNVSIFSSTSHEFVTSCIHRNNRDFWVLVHEDGSDNFRAYLISSAGVSAPVISSVAPFLATGSIACNGKASPDGKYIAVGLAAVGGGDYLYDFNNATGVVSNPTKLSPTYSYGIEFSPDSEKLYTKSIGGDSLLQFDLTAGTRTDIRRSRTMVSFMGGSLSGAMQLAEDGRIYFVQGATTHLGVIKHPNLLGSACGVVADTISLSGKGSTFGLPAFIQSIFNNLNFTYENVCRGDTTCFQSSGDTMAFDSMIWDFGDPSTGPLNHAKGYNPKHIYSDSGLYEVCAITYDTLGYVDTVCLPIRILVGPRISLPRDTILCEGAILEIAPLFSTEPAWFWSDSSTDSSFTITTSGNYWVENSNICDKARDSISVEYHAAPSPNLGPDLDLCDGETVVLDGSGSAEIVNSWQDGSSGTNFEVSTAGTYWLAQTNACGTYYDTIEVSYTSPPRVNIPDQDSIVCIGDELVLKSGDSEGTISWSDGSSGTEIIVRQPGIYWLQISNFCGVDIDSLYVDFANCCAVGLPNAFSPNGDGVNDQFGVIKDYCELVEYSLEIFNRLGQRVFLSNNPDEMWDGTLNGKELDLGVYVYQLSFVSTTEDINGLYLPGERQLKSGNVTLIR